MKIDVASARARAGSRYPKPFDEPCQNKTRRRLGLAAGLTQFGVNLAFERRTAVRAMRVEGADPPLLSRNTTISSHRSFSFL